MEPVNTPLEEENHLPNHHFQLTMLIFGGCMYILVIVQKISFAATRNLGTAHFLKDRNRCRPQSWTPKDDFHQFVPYIVIRTCSERSRASQKMAIDNWMYLQKLDNFLSFPFIIGCMYDPYLPTFAIRLNQTKGKMPYLHGLYWDVHGTVLSKWIITSI